MPSGQRANPLHLEVPIQSAGWLNNWGRTLVVAPHQDDESLGCGGVIALLRQGQQAVEVVFVSDGSMSHPRSQKYPADARRRLREQEATEALHILGVASSAIHFMRWQDTQVPRLGSKYFEKAVAEMVQHLKRFQPNTILLPWQRDPHCDHRASWEIAQVAAAEVGQHMRMLAYPIWIWELAAAEDWPRPDEVQVWKLDISSVLPDKKAAIAAHLSQTTRLIDDDPEGFILTKEILSHFTHSYEIFLEPSAYHRR